MRHVGLLFPALSEPGVEMLRQEEERERAFAEVQLVDARRTCRLSPLLARDAVHGGLLQPDGRQVPTRRVIAALARRLAGAGVEVPHRRGRPSAWSPPLAGCSGVLTTDGPIAAGVFVNAAGAGTHALAARDGIAVAAVPLLESRS